MIRVAAQLVTWAVLGAVAGLIFGALIRAVLT